MSMGPLHSKTLTGRLRLALAVLLALHLGLAQPGAAHAALAEGAQTVEASAEAPADLDPPCHHATADSPSPQPALPGEGGRRHGPCCNPGNCHCSAACAALAVPVIARVRIGRSAMPRLAALPLHVLTLAPDLRPPIAG
jgi:hypothetical protein